MTRAETITVTSPAFEAGGPIPVQYTGKEEDISPPLHLSDVSDHGVSLVVIMDDASHPLFKNFNHWVMWNIPPGEQIPENITHGATVSTPDGAVQGMGYGQNRYKGPNPPAFMREAHHYIFHVYVLDCMLELAPHSRKKNVLEAMDGHIIQYGSVTGLWSNAYLK
ncbi:MAG TPA: YbhB/YbcL family Raf kinase inhibitor-like protein [Clostridiales bacterium]|nr:YbhB/YbcL family Raf kinase inhibitor-like protein [Clostridiales bacterium]